MRRKKKNQELNEKKEEELNKKEEEEEEEGRAPGRWMVCTTTAVWLPFRGQGSLLFQQFF